MVTTKAILKKIGIGALSLHKGNGYWYFAYAAGKRFETYSVFTSRLNDLSEDRWIEEGRAFCELMQPRNTGVSNHENRTWK